MKKQNWLKTVKRLRNAYQQIDYELDTDKADNVWCELDYILDVLLDEVHIEPTDWAYDKLFDYIFSNIDITAEDLYEIYESKEYCV